MQISQKQGPAVALFMMTFLGSRRTFLLFFAVKTSLLFLGLASSSQRILAPPKREAEVNMKFLFLAVLFVIPMKSIAQESSSEAAAQAASARCVKNLVSGDYASSDLAEQLCSQFSSSTIGCAMDMIDMKMESDIFEAIEYCADPIVRR